MKANTLTCLKKNVCEYISSFGTIIFEWISKFSEGLSSLFQKTFNCLQFILLIDTIRPAFQLFLFFLLL